MMELLGKIAENKRYVLLILAIIGIFIYSETINAPFLFDDNLLVEKNTLIRSLANFFKFFVVDSNEGAFLSSSQFYRPFQYLAYSLIYSVFKLNPVPYHLLSIFFHILNSFLVFYLINKLKFNRFAAFFAALFFLVHPVQAEAVSYVSGLADPMSFFFVFCSLSVLLKLKVLNKKIDIKLIFFGSMLYLCALFSKETSLLLPLLSFLIILYPNGFNEFKKNKSLLYFLLSTFFISLIYILLRLTVLNFTGVVGSVLESNAYTESILLRVLTFVNIIWEYFKLLFFPVDLYLEKEYSAYAYIFMPRTIFGYFVIFGGFFSALYSIIKGQKKFALAFFWTAFSFLPVSGLVPLNAIFLEHWLYYPIVGILIWMAAIFDAIKSKKMLVIFSSILLLSSCFLSYRAMLRNKEWADPIKFYKNEIKYMSAGQKSARVFNNLGMSYANIGMHKEAINSFKEAIEIWDVYPQTHHNLANQYHRIGLLDLAIEEETRALEIDPNFFYSKLALYKYNLEKESIK